ncbi:putative zinc knuckle domain protein (Byr3) [Aspergillus puulaauensis]|uniref:CCHC-type domain-containing protein n=1 Tax=Aspergillus puulaauensis TaxID=1220207 RepID=A0A7R8AMV8_9EURO|nr:uncharacterized protein APUU_41205A [Aspergillus puulaauensis]BCS24761.1 hypothetical protein APUU_41205A [Aspergillus puulaauensis]
MSFGGRVCFNCGEATHQARDCPKKGTPTCYNCGGMQHFLSFIAPLPLVIVPI